MSDRTLDNATAPSPTFVNGPSSPNQPRRRWLRRSLLGCAGLLAACIIYLLVPGHIHRKAHGWNAELTYIKYGCRFCLTHVEQLTNPAGAVQAPLFPESSEDKRDIYLASPVGTYFSNWKMGMWHVWHGNFEIVDVSVAIEASELARGFYHLPASEMKSNGWVRKAGTPQDWCLLFFWDESGSWWVRPDQVNAFLSFVKFTGFQILPMDFLP